MRLAVGQPDTRNLLEDNVSAACLLAREARAQDAQLLLLSELFLSGYRPRAIAADPRRLAVTLDDQRLSPLVEVVQACGVPVALGAALRDSGTGELRNAMLWFKTDGTVQHVYSKIHLWTSERPVFTPGDRQAIVEFGGLRMGIGICYDAGFPEFVRSYARAKADAVLFGSAFAVGDEEHRYRIYHPSRALENGIYVAVANCIGLVDSREYFGHSQIFDRQGRRLLDVEPTVQIGVADLADVESDTGLADYLTDLRPTLFEPDHFEG
jgi:predicted amidohydrolase